VPAISSPDYCQPMSDMGRCCRKIGLFGGMSTETGLVEAPNRLKPLLLILPATHVSREWRPFSTVGGCGLGVLAF
jgi:hypothetical protein